MIADTVEHSCGLVTVTRGGLLPAFATLTLATAEVPVMPDTVVCAAIQWDPSGTVCVSQARMYGEVVTGPPSGWPSSRNCTDVPASGLAARFTGPETIV
jgi:hypothetical protein